MFVVLFGGAVFLYMLLGQLKIFFSKEEVTWELEKNFLFKLTKNKFFKLTIVAYFLAFTFFYRIESMDYYGKDRAYPKAKSFAIVGDLVYFWHSVGINARWIKCENKLDNKIQTIQSLVLEKMYQYIPKQDGEREFWYYKYRQLYIAKTRYKPEDSPYNPHPRFSKIMDGLYNTSYKLYEKPFKDKVINNERYVFIAQMSYYLINNIAYYATYERSQYLDKLFEFMGDKELFKRNTEYANLILNIYKKFKADREVAKVFNNNPYSLGILYSSLLYSYDNTLNHNSHFNINPCTSKEIKIFTSLVEEFYAWIFKNKGSSYHQLSQREKKQMKWLYNSCALSFSYGVATYICEIPLKYKDSRRLEKYHDFRILPVYKNEEEFLSRAVTVDDFIEFSKLENLLNERNKKNQITNQKDK